MNKYKEVGGALCQCSCPDSSSSVYMGFFFGGISVGFVGFIVKPWYDDRKAKTKKKEVKA